MCIFAAMIAEIKADSTHEDEPLLEYVGKVANEFWLSYDPEVSFFTQSHASSGFVNRLREYVVKVINKFLTSLKPNIEDNDGETGAVQYGAIVPSNVPHVFANRYVRIIKDKLGEEVMQRYEDSVEIQNTLKAFGIDKDKFWYLCVCVKDYVEGMAYGAKRKPTHREELKSLVDKLSIFDEGDIMSLKAAPIGELTLKIDNKKSVTITDPVTLYLISFAVSDLLSQNKENNVWEFDSSIVDLNDKEVYLSKKQFYWFNKYLRWFLKDYQADKAVCKSLSVAANRVSTDKRLLVSRMIYVFGMTDNENYYADGMDALKNMLAGCNDDSMRMETHNKYYWG